MSGFLTKPKWCIAVISGAVLVGYWAQLELRAQHTTDAKDPGVHREGEAAELPVPPATDTTDRSVAEAYVNDYRDYLDGQQGRVVIPHTGNPEIDEACREAFLERHRDRRRRHMEEVQREHIKKREIWQGTTAAISQSVSGYEMVNVLRQHEDWTNANLAPDDDEESDTGRESVSRFVELFAKEDPPAPTGRRERFAEFLQPDSPDRCVGWRYLLKSAEEVDDGWLVDVEVIPKLMGLTPKTVFTSSSTYEVWHVGRDGKLTPVEVTPGHEGILGRL